MISIYENRDNITLTVAKDAQQAHPVIQTHVVIFSQVS